MPVRTVPIKNISIPSGNREQIDEAELQALAATLKEKGMLMPIIARPIGFGAAESRNGKFELIAGERRLRAAQDLGWQEIEVRVCDASDEEARELRLIENTQRVPLSAWEEADQVLALDPNLPLEEIGRRLGRTPQWVAVRRAIGRLIPSLKTLVREQNWPMSHLPLLARFPAVQQPAILETIQDMQKVVWYDYDESGKNGPTVPSYRDLLEYLETHQRLLTSAPWKLDDAELVGKAGACNVCPKRSSAESLLFPELADAKSDRCLDEGCWQAKQAALVHLSAAKIAEKGKTPVFLKAYDPITEEAKQAIGPVKVESWSDFQECKKNTPGAMPAVVVSGNETGKTVYVKSRFESSDKPNGKSERPINQETGEREEPTNEERMAALRLKRLCRAGEIWIEKLPTLKPPFKGVVDGLLIWFGTHEKRAIRGDWDWDERAKRKLSLNADGWEQLAPVFKSRLHRFGPMEQGEGIWREAVCQAQAIGFKAALDQCWEQAVSEIGLTRVLKDAGVVDETAVPA